MAASLDDIFTVSKHIAQAINNQTQTYLNVNAATTAAGLTAATVVKSAGGLVCTVSVIVAGAATGMIYDTATATSTSNPIYVIPTTVGVYLVNMPTSFGIVVAPGSGQTVSVSYS